MSSFEATLKQPTSKESGSAGMRGELFEQQLGYSVGLLVEHPMRDTLEDLEAVLAADVAAIGVRPLTKQACVTIAQGPHVRSFGTPRPAVGRERSGATCGLAHLSSSLQIWGV